MGGAARGSYVLYAYFISIHMCHAGWHYIVMEILNSSDIYLQLDKHSAVLMYLYTFVIHVIYSSHTVWSLIDICLTLC